MLHVYIPQNPQIMETVMIITQIRLTQRMIIGVIELVGGRSCPQSQFC